MGKWRQYGKCGRIREVRRVLFEDSETSGQRAGSHHSTGNGLRVAQSGGRSSEGDSLPETGRRRHRPWHGQRSRSRARLAASYPAPRSKVLNRGWAGGSRHREAARPVHFDGTIGALIEIYLTDRDSPYRRLETKEALARARASP